MNTVRSIRRGRCASHRDCSSSNGLLVHRGEIRKELKAAQYYRDYYLRNKNSIKESRRSYYGRHKDTKRLLNRDYYARNKDTLREYYCDYNVRKKDDILASKRRYYSRNKDNKRRYDRDYYLRNKDDIRDSNRDYYVKNKLNPDDYSPRDIVLKSWKSPDLVREYFESISSLLLISNYNDWYRVSRHQIGHLRGMSSRQFWSQLIL
jgi:hypothetical protein